MKFAVFALATLALYAKAVPVPVTQDEGVDVEQPFANSGTSRWVRKAEGGVDAEVPFANSGSSRWARRAEEELVQARGSIPTEPSGYLNGPTAYWARRGEEKVNAEVAFADSTTARWVRGV